MCFGDGLRPVNDLEFAEDIGNSKEQEQIALVYRFRSG